MRFDVYRPTSLEDALKALKTSEEPLKPLAGGTDVLVLLRDGKVRVKKVLDLWPLRKDLSYVKIDGDILRIGALTTVTDFCSWGELKNDVRLAGFRDVCMNFASPHIRNVATIGGNIGTSHPLSDFSVLLLTYDATVILTSLNGEREVPLTNFFTGLRTNVRKPYELITEINFKIPSENTSSAFMKFDRRWGHSMGYVLSAALMTLENNVIKEVRLAFDSVSKPHPERAFKTEGFLKGKSFSEDLIDKACNEVLPTEMKRIDDYRASAEYRLYLSKVLMKRALFEIKNRIGGE